MSPKKVAKTASAPRASAPASPRMGVVLSVDDEHLENIDAIEKKVVAAGLVDVHTSPLLGTITGAIPREQVRRLRAIGGVSSVELDRTVRAL